MKDSNNINLLIKERLLIAPDEPILNDTVRFFLLSYLNDTICLLYNYNLIVVFDKNVCNILKLTVMKDSNNINLVIK